MKSSKIKDKKSTEPRSSKILDMYRGYEFSYLIRPVKKQPTMSVTIHKYVVQSIDISYANTEHFVITCLNKNIDEKDLLKRLLPRKISFTFAQFSAFARGINTKISSGGMIHEFFDFNHGGTIAPFPYKVAM